MSCHARAAGEVSDPKDVSAPMDGSDAGDMLLDSPKPARAVPDKSDSTAKVRMINRRFIQIRSWFFN
jgi:hypothetical protein